jgi:hypothetical protein
MITSMKVMEKLFVACYSGQVGGVCSPSDVDYVLNQRKPPDAINATTKKAWCWRANGTDETATTAAARPQKRELQRDGLAATTDGHIATKQTTSHRKQARPKKNPPSRPTNP